VAIVGEAADGEDGLGVFHQALEDLAPIVERERTEIVHMRTEHVDGDTHGQHHDDPGIWIRAQIETRDGRLVEDGPLAVSVPTERQESGVSTTHHVRDSLQRPRK